MRRRALLSTLAGAALPLAAGCSSAGEVGTSPDESPEDSTTGTAEDTPTETPANGQSTGESTQDHALVTIHDVAVQQGYVVREVADAIGVVGDENRYVWVRVSVEGTALDTDAFALDTGMDSYEPIGSPRAYRFEGEDSPYTRQSGRGWLLFELPLDVQTSQQGDDPEMTFSNPVENIELERSIADRIARGRPEFSVTIQEQYAETPSKPIAIEIANEGGTDQDRSLPGRFVGALNRQGPDVAVTPVQRVAVDVPAGETRTVEIAEDWHEHVEENTDEESDRTVEYKLNWAGDSTSMTIEDL